MPVPEVIHQSWVHSSTSKVWLGHSFVPKQPRFAWNLWPSESMQEKEWNWITPTNSFVSLFFFLHPKSPSRAQQLGEAVGTCPANGNAEGKYPKSSCAGGQGGSARTILKTAGLHLESQILWSSKKWLDP